MQPEEIQRIVEGYFESVGASDEEEFVDQFSDDVMFADPIGTPVLTGRSGVARFHKGVEQAWSRLHMQPQEVFVRDQRAAVKWTAEGESRTGKTINFEGIDTFTVNDDGKITHVEGYWDFENVIGQM